MIRQRPSMLNREAVRRILKSALREDLGPGDITTESILTGEELGRAQAVAKGEMIVAGLPVFGEAFGLLDEKISIAEFCKDGDRLRPQYILAECRGRLGAILSAERVALNLLQRLSGIATLTGRFVEAAAGTGVRILDTRKTIPGLRILDKYAVRVGGGFNHRFGLADGILIKENHIAAAGGIAQAITRVRRSAHHLLKIEIETANLTEVKEALAAGADVIMLDNMSLAEMKEAVALVAGRVPLEASGNVTLANVRRIAECGVDMISVGALTHSAPAADISLLVTTG